MLHSAFAQKSVERFFKYSSDTPSDGGTADKSNYRGPHFTNLVNLNSIENFNFDRKFLN